MILPFTAVEKLSDQSNLFLNELCVWQPSICIHSSICGGFSEHQVVSSLKISKMTLGTSESQTLFSENVVVFVLQNVMYLGTSPKGIDKEVEQLCDK